MTRISNYARMVLLSLAFTWMAAPAGARAQPPTPAEITRALETVKADPNLAPTRRIRILRWRDSSTPQPSRRPTWLAWLGWLIGLFRWLDQSARFLVWGIALALGAALLVYLARLAPNRHQTITNRGTSVPVRVHDLDIRPESLPDDIGAAARRLWDRSEQRAALALLYRGMLSRLVHVHEVPIRDSTTEADCLVLASTHLEPPNSEYASHLVGVWQRAVYGCEQIQPDDVYRLCDSFAAALDRGTHAIPGSRA